MRLLAPVLLCIGIVGQAAPTFGQSPGTEGSAARDATSPVFRSGVDLVSLSVVVTDPQQHLIQGLPRGAFEVREDNVLQVVSYFDSVSVPLDLAVVIDTSASMAGRMHELHDAANRFLDVMRPGDRVMVVAIGARARLLHPLDDDAHGAAAAIRSTNAAGNTALYDAVYLALHELRRQRPAGAIRRQVVTVFSDGEDTASLVGLDAVLELARRTGITAYTLLLRAETDSLRQANLDVSERAAFALKDLARESGGRAFSAVRMAQVPDMYAVIAAELGAQYTLGYVSTNAARDGRLRQVRIRMTGVQGTARTRMAYYAAGSSWRVP